MQLGTVTALFYFLVTVKFPFAPCSTQWSRTGIDHHVAQIENVTPDWVF